MSRRAFLLNDTRVDAHFGCDLVCSAIEHLLAVEGIELVGTSPAHHDWRKDNSIQELMATAQLILVNGEGTIHHERPAGEVLLQAGEFARRHGIPAALINAGWEGNGPHFAGLLRNFSLISFRDKSSATEVRNLGIRSRVVPDLSLFEVLRHTDRTLSSSSSSRLGVGVTDSVDRLTSSGLSRLARKIDARPISIHHGSQDLLRFIRAGVSVREDIWHPLRMSRSIRNRFSLWRAGLSDADSFVNRVNSLELLVSGRFHACTVALATRTPIIGVRSNTEKIRRLFEDVGLNADRSISLADLGKIDLSNASFSATELENLTGYLHRAVADARKLFKDIGELAAINRSAST